MRDSDDGVQSIDDSTEPQLPTDTFTVGLSSTIAFERMTKIVSGGKGSVNWSKINSEHFVVSELDDGSIFVLERNSDKLTESQPGEGVIHKTKHPIDFHGDGISIAFVFGLV